MVTIHVTKDWNEAIDKALESPRQHGHPVAVLWHDDSYLKHRDVAFGAVVTLSHDHLVHFDLGVLRPGQRHFEPKQHEESATCLQHEITRDIVQDAQRLENALGDACYDLMHADAIRDFFVDLLYLIITEAFNAMKAQATANEGETTCPS